MGRKHAHIASPVLNIWSVYKERGFFQQCTDEAGLATAAEANAITGYIGFDPTADSFHAGHLIPLMSLVHFQRAGHRPIALMGGGTAMIGDPTGRNEMRRMLSVEQLDRNIEGLKRQLMHLLDFEAGAILVNNAEWLRGLRYIDFLREIGPHFSVNRMLTFETFRTRLEGSGLSFIEFNYPLLQAYDFLELHRRYGCVLQMGGDDQWANIISGVDLVRRMARQSVYGWTFPLHTTASGAKMGKTEAGAVWLDPAKTSPYDYYQYWINVDDADAGKCLRLFTLLADEEIGELARLEGADIRRAKQVLAFEATRLIHGEEEARRAQKGARALFGGDGGDLADAPTTTLASHRLAGGLPVWEILAEVGLTRSRGEARRLIRQGGVSVNNDRVDSQDFALSTGHVEAGAILLRVGKKKYHRLVVE
ncbi:MAG: tyrosine--tRNA ligase [SAR324 cluster bacterium]|nr:tyrosine--tRNA ligase [SAR324 cluster bacterium]